MSQKSEMVSIETTLKDGTVVLIRQIQPQDKAELKAGFNQLSARSRRLRFLSIPSRLTDDQLRFLTEVDHVRHEALCVIDIEKGPRCGIGVGRYVHVKGKRKTAEFAVTVLDAYQGRGLGTILVNLLMQRASKNGYRRLIGYILVENQPMLAVMRKLGAKLERADESVFRAELALKAPTKTSKADTPAHHRLP
jgi:RimJ/RimL family protein N-acetyltransferase